MKNDKYVDMFGAMYSKYFVRDVASPVLRCTRCTIETSIAHRLFRETFAIYNQYEAFDFTFLKIDNSRFRDTTKFRNDVSIFIYASFREFVFIV